MLDPMKNDDVESKAGPKRQTLSPRFPAWSAHPRLRYLKQIGADELRQFRANWDPVPWTARGMHEQLRKELTRGLILTYYPCCPVNTQTESIG